MAIQHRGGNKQVLLGNGDRWHLPRGKNYEILSGTESNFALHGRRMASTFFRMIFF